MVKLIPTNTDGYKVYLIETYLGSIYAGCIYGEWWCEPVGKRSPQLIKGKKQAIKFLTPPLNTLEDENKPK